MEDDGLYRCMKCGKSSYELTRLWNVGGALYCDECRPVLNEDRLFRLEERVTRLEEGRTIRVPVFHLSELAKRYVTTSSDRYKLVKVNGDTVVLGEGVSDQGE